MGKALIHLVDDDAAVRGTLARLLISGGYEVREYASGAALLDAAEALAEGYILLDIDMPDADGFAVKRALTDKAIDLPVVMMTGAGDLTILAMKAGVAKFIQKPFDRSELLATLDELSAPCVAEARLT